MIEKDLTPNICAVFTEEEYRNQGIAGKLLNIAVTDHIGSYERYGW